MINIGELIDPPNFRFWILDFGFFGLQAPPLVGGKIYNRQSKIPKPRTLVVGVNLKSQI
jgi:hypothetical protein